MWTIGPVWLLRHEFGRAAASGAVSEEPEVRSAYRGLGDLGVAVAWECHTKHWRVGRVLSWAGPQRIGVSPATA